MSDNPAQHADDVAPDDVAFRCVQALISHDGTMNEQCPTPWRWHDEVGEDLSYFRIVEIVRATLIDGSADG